MVKFIYIHGKLRVAICVVVHILLAVFAKRQTELKRTPCPNMFFGGMESKVGDETKFVM